MKRFYLLTTMVAVGLTNFASLKAMELYLVTQISIGRLTVNDLWFLQGAKISFPFWFQVFFIFLGVILGFPLGQRWWYVVYVEKKHFWFKLTRRKVKVNK
ncbi:hypothetical protein HOB25_03355 [bacterium]|jgi:hypothetical protein|nr:hypothetical protein [bacterium]MBT6753998.1 hypothetical protein [bacterium]MBT7037544.1 hypothetical protein [bacterium]MBT7992730.1 hypothetical protein [bacterium]